MSIPDFQSLMLPLLRIASDSNEHSIHEYADNLAKLFNLSESEIRELLPSGNQTTFYNRVGWARTYLVKSGLLEMIRRKYYKITQQGLNVLKDKPSRIDMKFLEQFPEYVEFKKKKGTRLKTKEDDENTKESKAITPEETLEEAFQEMREGLAQEVLELVKKSSPAFFEQLEVDLLVKMGYGGSRKEAARAVGKSGDEGIDGIIDEDRLGLDSIYIQAKKWESVVGRPEIQKFIGALSGQRARKGIFITTSSFTSDAINFTKNIEYKLVLIDGKRLAEFMIDYDVGVTESTIYKLKRIDSDYFES
jgi:restriction system protein